MKTSELLRKAADEIRRRGWYQGGYGSDISEEGFGSCKVCSLGAVNAASYNGDPWNGMLFKDTARERAILLLEESAGGTLPHWNDAPGRTVEEVLDVFEKAAQAAELEES